MLAARQTANCWHGTGPILVTRTRRRGGVCRAQTEIPSDPVDPVCVGFKPSTCNTNVSVWQIPNSPDFPPEMRGARVLMLDESGNLHSVYREGQALTGAYWDCLALLPAVVPEGPVAILGLGAGTIAHIVHALYPQRQMHGWELDPAVVALAQQHMGLQQLTNNGCLVAHVGDALADSAGVAPPGAAGIVVDLFAAGQLIPQLTQASAWASIRRRLAPGGRVMTNLGAAPVAGMMGRPDPAVATTRQALAAMAEAFEGQLSYCSFMTGASANMVVITGPPISSQDWAAAPQQLQHLAKSSWEMWKGSNS
ncbi:hypothetical protein OEZ85_012044 [Tetradesmus obliquus]|uniref:PABS domain-containing protein n=1 Tax=Tetradesmus obliquus TaxID=3088 RepID=A0ABY8TS62_TETOB|nr:hypothetical protein OEZ85_012044 [Tetradesmus obliquus]